MQYLTSEQYVDGEKMAEILRDKELVANLKKGLKDIEDGDYSIFLIKQKVTRKSLVSIL